MENISSHGLKTRGSYIMYVTTYNAIFLKDFSSHGGSFFKYSVGFEKYQNKLAKNINTAHETKK